MVAVLDDKQGFYYFRLLLNNFFEQFLESL